METSFDEFINQQVAKREAEPPVDPDEARRQWKQDLEQFNGMVEEFLREYIDQKKVSLSKITKNMNEEIIGNYEADSLVIEIGTSKVYFDPVGRYVIGAKGRVDMSGPHGTVKFLLVPKDASAPRIGVRRVSITEERPPESELIQAVQEPWVWKIGTPPPKSKYIELEKESFHTAVMEVVNG